MSGKPITNGVSKAIALIQQLRSLNEEIAYLEAEAAKLDDKRKYRDNAYGDLRGLIAEMDLVSSGNFGYENRMAWFLSEFLRQVKAEAS